MLTVLSETRLGKVQKISCKDRAWETYGNAHSHMLKCASAHDAACPVLSTQTWIVTEGNSSGICSTELSSGDCPGEAIGFSHVMRSPPGYHYWLVS